MIYLIRTTNYNIKNKEVIDFTKDGSRERYIKPYKCKS